MAPAAKIADNGLNVKPHTTVRSGQAIAVISEEKPVRQAAGTRQPGAAGIEGADTADETIRGEMSMAADDDLSVGSGKQLPELLIGDARIDSRAVVSARRRMDTQDGSSAPEPQTQLRRETGQDIDQPALVQDATSPGDPRRHRRVALH